MSVRFGIIVGPMLISELSKISLSVRMAIIGVEKTSQTLSYSTHGRTYTLISIEPNPHTTNGRNICYCTVHCCKFFCQ